MDLFDYVELLITDLVRKKDSLGLYFQILKIKNEFFTNKKLLLKILKKYLHILIHNLNSQVADLLIFCAKYDNQFRIYLHFSISSYRAVHREKIELCDYILLKLIEFSRKEIRAGNMITSTLNRKIIHKNNILYKDNLVYDMEIENIIDSNIQGSSYKMLNMDIEVIPRKYILNLQGIFLYLASAPVLLFSDYRNILGYIGTFKQILRERYRTSYINNSVFSKNIQYYTQLGNISLCLRDIDRPLRKKLFVALLEIFNYKNRDVPVLNVFTGKFSYMNIVVENSDLLDSAKNVPFLITYLEEKAERPDNYEMKLKFYNDFMMVDDFSLKIRLVNIFLEKIEIKKRRRGQFSKFIIKTGELLREFLGLEFLKIFSHIIAQANLLIVPYEIYLINHNIGIVKYIDRSKSIHSIKRDLHFENKFFLKDYFLEQFKENLEEALDNFTRSFIAYALLSYFIELRDRHNGNILISSESGRLIHIDFGFLFGLHPGIYNVEMAPFKITSEIIELLELGKTDYRKLFYEGFLHLRNNFDVFFKYLKISQRDPNFSFLTDEYLNSFKNKFLLEMKEEDLQAHVYAIVDNAISDRTTALYDSLQYFSNGYFK